MSPTKHQDKKKKSTAALQPEGEGEGEKPSLGEELWKVHCSRNKGEIPNENDFDHEYPTPRKRSRSIGEELWEVHCKRSAGLPPDIDIEKKEEPAQKKKAATHPHKKQQQQHKTERCSDRIARVMHLRNRDVKRALC